MPYDFSGKLDQTGFAVRSRSQSRSPLLRIEGTLCIRPHQQQVVRSRQNGGESGESGEIERAVLLQRQCRHGQRDPSPGDLIVRLGRAGVGSKGPHLHRFVAASAMLDTAGQSITARTSRSPLAVRLLHPPARHFCFPQPGSRSIFSRRAMQNLRRNPYVRNLRNSRSQVR